MTQTSPPERLHDPRAEDGRPQSPRSGVRAAIVREGQVLLNEYTGGVLDLPGGGQEHGEDLVSALRRECREEIGADVEVHTLAMVYEILADRALRSGDPIPLFHQVNLVFWCGLAPGQEPRLGDAPDGDQVGCRWVPIAELDRHDVLPREVADWLMSDPSARRPWLGTVRTDA